MAAWQFDVLAVFDGSTSLPPALKRRAEKLLAEHFGPPSEMFKEFRVYGAARGNRIDLIVGEDGCGELWMRVDARAEIDTFMRQVVILMIEMECSLKVAETGQEIPAQIDLFNKALQTSDAWKFVLGADPSAGAGLCG